MALRSAWLPVALALLTGCAAGPESVEPAFEPVAVAPIVSGLSAKPDTDEAEVREEFEAGRYEAAAPGFERLAGIETDPARRAELLFAAAECWLAAGDHEHAAWKVYERLLRDYPSTPRYELIVERLFLVGRRFCDGLADRPSLLLGISVSDRKLGITILEAFQRSRERHPLADDALQHVALAQLDLEEYELAIAAWQKLMDEYPTSEWAETAEYRIGLTFGLMSDGVEYDKRPLLTSLVRLRRYTQRYPKGDHIDEATAEIARLEQELASHQLGVARFYLRRDRRYAAQITLDELVREYPTTVAAADATRLQRSLPRTSPPPPPPEPDEAPVDAGPPPPPPDVLAAPAD